ncbi:hypothetical protein SR882_09925 [Guyparkeria halophila]|uniref:Tripartite tricarboxylate transporter TctB family protein n=1 Tax=Guyparkeria halophila TaxID=47960 RepID=A0ABZ0YWC9_9GAMM|nr:hypothetical protein [Guyparkeria halophila]WQH16068.1 hypothetical protein SR882_09925 [Guyparkeria halophila]
MTEPTVNRPALALWMSASLAVAVLLLWLGADLHPPGAASARTLPASPLTGAMGFAFLLAWAAFAYAASITTPHRGAEHVGLWASLLLPLAIVVLLGGGQSLIALLLAIAWLATLIWTGWQLARREALAGLMMLPVIGSAIASMLLSLTLWVLP